MTIEPPPPIEPPPDPPPVDPPPPPIVAWPSPSGGGSWGRGGRLAMIGAAVLSVVAVITVIVLRSGSVAPHPPPRELPHPIRDAVVLVPLGDFPVDRANDIAAKEAADYGLPIWVAPALPIDRAALDPARGQLTAERLSEGLARAHPELRARTLVIGLTTQDIYTVGRADWRYAFGIRNNNGVAVVSSARMGRSFDPGGEWNRLTKMVTRDIGFLYYGLEATGDRGDILYENILGLDDLVRIGDRL